jgi:hypothetical protein
LRNIYYFSIILIDSLRRDEAEIASHLALAIITKGRENAELKGSGALLESFG